jgi:aldehyde dehydrogenase (NAD+)
MFAAWADKYDGAVHHTPQRNVTLAMPEAVGTLALICPDELPLLGLVTLIAPAIAQGNTVIAVPSQLHPLAGTDFYQVLETSDVPAGVINIVTGARAELAEVLAAHMDVDGLWHFGPQAEHAVVERASCSNLKQLWSGGAPSGNLWQCDAQEFLRHATQIKNIWVPYGA